MYNISNKLVKAGIIRQTIKAIGKKGWDKTVFRFLCVGSFNTVLDFTTLNVLVQLIGLPVLVANSISVSVGITISYFLNHRVVFRHPYSYSFKSYLHFFLVTGVSVIVIQNLVIFAASKLGVANSSNHVHLLLFNVSDKTVVLNMAKALAILIGMVWNFLLYKFVVFRHHKKDEDMAEEIVVA